MKKKDKLKTLQQVEVVLEKYVSSRDDDLILWSWLMTEFYPLPERMPSNWYELASIINHTPSLDYIARCRRNIIDRYKYMKFLPTTLPIATNRGIDKVKWNRYAKANPLAVNMESNITAFDNYPSHMTPNEIERAGI
jgi:hypothetical protein